MFEGFKDVPEVGAGDGFKEDSIVGQFCKRLTLSDIEMENLKEYNRTKIKNYKFILNDFVKKSIPKKFDGIYLLDVLEQVLTKKRKFIFKKFKKMFKTKNGTLIVGMPSLESQKYASKLSKIGQGKNCKTKKDLKNFYTVTLILFTCFL